MRYGLRCRMLSRRFFDAGSIFFYTFLVLALFSFTGNGAAEDTVDPPPPVNLDTIVLYGGYHRLQSYFALTQDYGGYAYQVISSHNRSNDYGYDNSSFAESEVELTSSLEAGSAWRIMPEVTFSNSSRGLFDNSSFSREERNHISGSVTQEYQPMPSRWRVSLEGENYDHRLVDVSGGVDGQSFSSAAVLVDWEYVWSAANKIHFVSSNRFYEYSGVSSDDVWQYNRISGKFRIARHLAIETGAGGGWNRDLGFYGNGDLELSLTGIPRYSLRAAYRYDMESFRPEELYRVSYRVAPTFDHDPSRIHRVDVEGAFSILSEDDARNGSLVVKGEAVAEDHSNYYFYMDSGTELLTIETVPARIYSTRFSLESRLPFNTQSVEIEASYLQRFQEAEDRIPYLADNEGEAVLRHFMGAFETSLKHIVRGSLYTDIAGDDTLPLSVVGECSIQYRTLEGFYLYMLCSNIYNSGYSMQKGYPEPGRNLLGGIRIIL